jgi:hypothetical protein
MTVTFSRRGVVLSEEIRLQPRTDKWKCWYWKTEDGIRVLYEPVGIRGNGEGYGRKDEGISHLDYFSFL